MFELDSTPIQQSVAVKERRYGIIIYSDAFIEDAFVVLQKIYSRVIPVQMRYDYANCTFEVQAVSNEFDPVGQGEVVPYYNCMIQQIQRKKSVYYKITFVKAEQ